MNTAKRHQFQPDNILLSVIKYAGNSFGVTGAAVFVITGHDSREYVAEAIRLGAAGYITKLLNATSLRTVQP